LWIAEAQRGQGLAPRLLNAAESEASARDCHGAYIDPFNPQALHVYQKAGHTVFGMLPHFPPGRTRRSLSKSPARRRPTMALSLLGQRTTEHAEVISGSSVARPSSFAPATMSRTVAR